jgi:mRNA interferase RelE/StbE
MYRAKLTAAAARDFDALPLTIKTRMLRLLERLDAWPSVSGAKPLSGKLAGRLRLRTGDYRLVFRVDGRAVVVERIQHRRDVYED